LQLHNELKSDSDTPKTEPNFPKVIRALKSAFSEIVGADSFTELSAKVVEKLLGENSEWGKLTKVEKHHILAIIQYTNSPSLSTTFAKVALSDLGRELLEVSDEQKDLEKWFLEIKEILRVIDSMFENDDLDSASKGFKKVFSVSN